MLLNSVGCFKLKVNVKGFIINEMGMNKKTPFDTKSYLSQLLQLAVKHFLFKPAIIFHKELLILYQFYPILGHKITPAYDK